MKLKAIFLSVIFTFSLLAPVWATQDMPRRPRRNADAVMQELLERIKEALERQRIERDAGIQRLLVMPGCNPVPVPPIPVPEKIEPEKFRWLPAEALRPGRLIPEKED